MFSAMIAEIGGYLILAAIAFLGTLGYGIKKKNDGKKEAVNEHNSEVLENVIEAHTNDAKVNKASESTLDDIGSDWVQDDTIQK